jgi:hypothetical protein
MKKNYKRVRTKFGPETRFELTPVQLARARQEAEFARLKNELLLKRLQDLLEPQSKDHLQVAAGEAAALAWVTPYPLLVFPVLFEEKAEAALLRSQRQAQVRRRSRDLLLA